MNPLTYCRAVDIEDSRNKLQTPTFRILESHVPSKSLLDSQYNLIFEPSIPNDHWDHIREDILEKLGSICRQLEKLNMTLIIRSA